MIVPVAAIIALTALRSAFDWTYGVLTILLIFPFYCIVKLSREVYCISKYRNIAQVSSKLGYIVSAGNNRCFVLGKYWKIQKGEFYCNPITLVVRIPSE